MEQRLQVLENREVVNKKVEETVKTFKKETKEKEQYDRNRNLEISQLEWLHEENLLRVINSLAQNFNVQGYNENQIEVAHRIPNKNSNKPSTVIIQFKHRDARNMWMQQRRKIVTNDNIYRNGNRQRIYLNENMTPYMKTLFWKTRMYARTNDYKYTWFRNGKIMMRKNENEQEVVTIHEEEDLTKLETKMQGNIQDQNRPSTQIQEQSV
jgi:hypothetical protein